jgi:hypothetical protein
MDSWTDQGATNEGQHVLWGGRFTGLRGACARRDEGYCRVCGEPCKPGRTEHRACAIAQWKAGA